MVRGFAEDSILERPFSIQQAVRLGIELRKLILQAKAPSFPCSGRELQVYAAQHRSYIILAQLKVHLS
jgi:hypothetical protein